MEEIQSGTHVLRFQGAVKSWPPSVDAARPGSCIACNASAYVGSRLIIHGHGLRERQQRGPASPDAAPSCAVCWVRRYLCTACDAVMTVLPAGAQPLKHFSGAAIAMALALWGGCGESARRVRERVNDWAPGPGAQGWRSLLRWAAQAGGGRLFHGLAPGVIEGSPLAQARRVAQALCGWAPSETRNAPLEEQAFHGAARM